MPSRRPKLAPLALAALLPAAAALAGCAFLTPPEPEPPPPPPRGFTLLAIDDPGRIEGIGPASVTTPGAGELGGLARVRTLRRELEAASGRPVPLLVGGDVLGGSLLSQRFGGEAAIDALNALDGDPEAFDPVMFATFGDRDLAGDGTEAARRLDRRVEESQFRWLAANVWFDDDGREPLVAADHLTEAAVITLGGVKTGLFGLAGESSRPDWVLGFHDREETARDAVASLRAAGAELVIALAHSDPASDLALLEALGDGAPDLVIGGGGGAQTARRGPGGRWVLEGDATTAVVVKVAGAPGGGLTIEPGVARLGPATPVPDPDVAVRVAEWLDRLDRDQCADRGLPPGCLRQALGRTRVPLAGAGAAARRGESNLGNWIADRLRDHFAAGVEASDPGAPLVALLDGSALDLGRDLPAGYIERRHVDEILPGPASPRLLRVDGATLRRAIEHAAARGRWLHVSGLAFVHGPAAGTVERLTVLGAGGPRPLDDRGHVYVATVASLVGSGDAAGPYPMLGPGDVVSESGVDLRRLVADELSRRWEEGIAPEVEGRICEAGSAGPCRAAAAE